MRATLEASCIYIPDDLSIWRRHPRQASQQDAHLIARKDGVFRDMAAHHYSRLETRYPEFSKKMDKTGLHKVYERDYENLHSATGAKRAYDDLDLMREFDRCPIGPRNFSFNFRNGWRADLIKGPVGLDPFVVGISPQTAHELL